MVLHGDVAPYVVSQHFTLLKLLIKLSQHDTRNLHDFVTLALDDRSHLEDLTDDCLIVHGLVTELRSRWEDQKLHGLPEVEVDVVVTASHEGGHLVTIDEVGHEFAIFNTSIDDYLMEGGGALAHVVNGGGSELHGGQGEVAEFNTLVHHAHGSEETCFNVILNVGRSYLSLVHEGVE